MRDHAAMKRSYVMFWSRLAWALLGLCVLFNPGCSKNNEPAATKQRELIVWHVEPTQGAVDVLNAIAKELERDNPGLKVVVENKPWLTLGAELASAISQQRSPDLSMVEPYMMSSLISQGLIEPLDDVYGKIGKEDVYPFLREMNTFENHLYGIPHAYGIGYFSVRIDLLKKLGLGTPKTWDEFLAMAQAMKTYYPAPVLLCGGTDFLLDQLFVNLVASNGGRMFDPQTNRPLFDSPEVIQTLEFFDRMAKFAPTDWKTRPYQDTFVAYSKGDAAIVPLTAARTINQIAKDAPPDIADPSHFGVFQTPVGPRGTNSFTFIDAEPWVVFAKSKNKDLARQFLYKFYSDETYLRFCRAVPLHLTPSRLSLRERYFNDPFLQKWHSWAEVQVQVIEGKKGYPLMSSSKEEHRLPFLWDVYQARIVTEMIGGKGAQTPVERAKVAQQRAEDLIAKTGYKKW
jgi:multiple sugar transport system substrate-binding protein